MPGSRSCRPLAAVVGRPVGWWFRVRFIASLAGPVMVVVSRWSAAGGHLINSDAAAAEILLLPVLIHRF